MRKLPKVLLENENTMRVVAPMSIRRKEFQGRLIESLLNYTYIIKGVVDVRYLNRNFLREHPRASGM